MALGTMCPSCGHPWVAHEEPINWTRMCRLCTCVVDLNRLTHDPVNHPSHYSSHPSGIECIQVTEYMNFCLGNATKYIWRAGLKQDESGVQDLEKAKWYLEREIARLRKAGQS